MVLETRTSGPESATPEGATPEGEEPVGEGARTLAAVISRSVLAPVPGIGDDDDALGAVVGLRPGVVAGLEGPAGSGLTRIGWSLLVPYARTVPVAAVDLRGWISPQAAWETGIAPDRLVVVRCLPTTSRDLRPTDVWPKVVAALLEGLPGVMAEVPERVPDAVLRRLSALARARRAVLLLRTMRRSLPMGVAQLRLRVRDQRWEGPLDGHGRLLVRRLVLEATGKTVGGRSVEIEVEDDGANPVRVVSGLAPASTRRSVL